jgi:hypothetical protein
VILAVPLREIRAEGGKGGYTGEDYALYHNKNRGAFGLNRSRRGADCFTAMMLLLDQAI